MRNRDHKNTYGLLQLLVHQGVSIGFQSQVAGVKVWEQSADVKVIFLASSHGWEGTGKEKGKGMGNGGIHRWACVRLLFVSSLRVARGAPILFGSEHGMAKTVRRGTAGRRNAEATKGYASFSAITSRPAYGTKSQMARYVAKCFE